MMDSVSLLDYTLSLRQAVASRPELRDRWVTAELSDVAVRGGHCYLELVEKYPDGRMAARMRATIWQSVYARLRFKFLNATGKEIAGGIKLMVRGSAVFHEVFGISFNISDIDPSYTLGDMERIRKEILDRLNKEGVAGYNRSLPMPPAPQRIAVISAAGAAGYGDFVNQLESNPYGIVFYTKLFPAVMQGERTSASVRSALEMIEMSIDLWDCVVIIRGGGASTDLNGFDDLDLARAVAMYPIPVIVGIGHERDRTVLDELANVRVKTPTAAAEWLVASGAGVLGRLTELSRMIVTETSERLRGAARQLSWLQSQVQTSASERISADFRRLSAAESLLPAIIRRQTERAHIRLSSAAGLLSQAGRARTAMQRDRLRYIASTLSQAASLAVEKEQTRVRSLEGLIEALSPENTLRRGYTLTLRGNKILKSAQDSAPGDRITTVFAGGRLESVIIKNEDNGK